MWQSGKERERVLRMLSSRFLKTHVLSVPIGVQIGTGRHMLAGRNVAKRVGPARTNGAILGKGRICIRI